MKEQIYFISSSLEVLEELKKENKNKCCHFVLTQIKEGKLPEWIDKNFINVAYDISNGFVVQVLAAIDIATYTDDKIPKRMVVIFTNKDELSNKYEIWKNVVESPQLKRASLVFLELVNDNA